MKKFLLSLAIALPCLAHSQDTPKFMGIQDLPLHSSETTLLLRNAIKNGDFVLINKWDKEIGLSIPYKENVEEFCYVGLHKNTGFLFETEKFKDKSPEYAVQTLSITQRYPIFANCNDLSFLHILENFKNNDDYPEYKVLGGRGKSKGTNIGYVTTLRKMVNEINPMLWEQLIPVVENEAVPFDIRKDALKKLIEIYPEKEKYGNKNQIAFWKAAEEYTKDIKNKPYYARYNSYNLSVDPLSFIYSNLFFKISGLSTVSADNETIKSLLTKDFFLGKKQVTIDDLKPIHKSSKEKIAAFELLREFELFNMLNESKLVSINKQTYYGNSMLHGIWFKLGVLDKGSDSRIFANFIRAQFESGLNPMILNQNKETSYSLFEKHAGSMKKQHYEPIREAFMLKEYNY